MKKRLLSWLLVLTMVISLIPSTLVTTAFAADNTSAQASGQAGKTKVELTNTWPSDLSADITDVTVTNTIAPGVTLTVGSGKTLILHGSGFISDGTANQTMVIVEEGGHLVLDEVTIQNNAVGSDGAIYVKSGGLLDLGYYDQRARTAPSITANTAKNLVVEEKATVRLNAEATKPIGISYAGDINETSPKSLMVGGRYAIQNSDMASNKISLDNATGLELVLKNDNIVVHPQKAKVLYWYPTNSLAWVLYNSERKDLQWIQAYVPGVQDRFQNAGAETTNLIGSRTNRKSFIGSNVGDLEKYDFIYITPGVPSGSQTVGAYTEEEAQALLKYLDKGGRIFIQVEDGAFRELNPQATALAQKLNAGFRINRDVSEIVPAENNPASPLTNGVTASWNVNWCSEILADKTEGVTPVFWVHGTTVGKVPFCMDITAGSAVDSTPWGNVTVISDANIWNDMHGFSSRSFAAALITNTVENRIIAATGVNPNLTVESQATIDGTDYPSVSAALAKVTETNTVTMLTNSNAALTPTRDELLFEQSTLAYEAGSQYDGSTIHADTAGVYLDITKTGEVNLRSGTVTVTPKDETYPLVLNGTMDDTGSTITGGYKITSATKYQLIADDPTSPFLAQNGGKASIVIPNAGESVTVDYGGGKTVTYTAKEQNEKVYLGWYQVTKQTPANMTWTDDGKAWYGQTFTTTLEPNAGYEINGENLTIADTDNAMTGGYTLKKQGEATVDPNDTNITWTTYSTDDGKVTVKQQHLHSGSSNYNGIAILTVNDVHADISIGAGNNTVNAKAPTIYVVGIGKRAGHEDVQLWEYTTVRNTKDGILDKPVSGWPWEKWKVNSAASGNGTESDYKQNKVTLTSDASKLDTSSDTAQYTINLETGDKVVAFYYDWNMVNVTIKATDANGNPIPDYTDQVVEYEIGKQTTITAPNLIGYQPVTGQNTQDFTPSETNKEITFQYEKTTGNLIYKAVYVDSASVTHDLGTFSGGTLVKGQAPNKSAQAAPTFYNYELVDADADGTATSDGDATKFDGTNDITVTYQYQPKTKDIAVYAYVGDENGQILNLDQTSYKGITTGQTITITAPEIAGYKVKGDTSKTFFITNNKTENQDVKFFYEKDNANDAYVLVKLVDSSNSDKVISSYQVPGVKDKAQLIKAPATPYGYKNDPNYNNEDQTVTPTGANAPFTAEVVFKYVPNVHTVNVVLKDKLNNTNLTVNNFKDTYQVVDGESLKITAPSIYGYTMADSAEAVKELTNITKDETVTFYYETTKASEYQTALTVEYKYNGYDLAEAKTINANTGEANSIDIPAFDGYKASTYDFKDGSKAPVTGAGISGTTVSVTPAEKTATLTITYTRPDGSIVLPGKGDKIGDSDDIIVKPTDPNTPPTLNPDNGSVTIPKDPAGNTGTVTRPKDPTRPADGKEDIIVPGGTTIDKDGTIHLPDNGGTINPGDKLPGATPVDYISVVYKANGGTGDDVIDLIKKDQTTINARTNPFTNGSQTFTGWNTAENGVGGTAYGENAPITIPNNSNTITLYAQWGKAEYKHTAKITYQANDGVTNAIEDTVGANDSTKFSINLRSNPFSVSGWDFGSWNTEANGTGTLKAANAVVEVTANNDQTWYAQWYKVGANGSITVPGDGNPNTTDDNVTANGTGVTRDPDTGNISIPAGGNVVKGNETIALPNGGTLKPDGSLSINKPNGGDQIEVKPDGSTDNADVVVLTYEANNGTNDTRKVYATKGEAIAPLAADTFSYSGHAFLYWKSGDDIFKTNGTITPTDDMTLSAVWAKVNNDSIELPGTDGKLEAPDNKDNVIVTPDQPNGKVTPQPDGSVKVEENGGTVTRPTDPDHPENGKEEIKVPEGTVVEPAGTIKLPDGTVIDPDKRVPDDVTPTNYFVVTYEPGDGSGDVIRDVITKNADTTLRDEDTFTAPNGKIFDGWLDGAQAKHDAGDTLTVSESMTFTAQWKDGTPTPPAPKYSATIVFDPNTGDATATQTVTSADSATITRNFDAYTQHFTAPAGWTFMGWSTTQAASQSSSFYADGAEETLKDGVTLNLYAILYKLDADTKVITLPGKGGQPEGGDDVTVTPGAGADLTVDKGFIKAPAGSEIKQPANATPIKVIEGEVNVYPDGTVYVPEGSKVQLPDGSEIKGETTVDPDGTPDVDNTKPVQKPDGTIVLPGQNGVIGTGDDDITIAPAGPNQPAGRIDEDGNVTITNPSGADVNIPGSNPADFKVPNGTVIKPNGDMTLLYTIRYVDGSGTEIKTATVKPVQRGISETVEAATITGYTVNGEATKTASGEVSANLADYTITFNYTKNSSGGGSSSGGGGGGSSTVSSYTIKASAGNGGIIFPSGNVSVKRGEDQSFHINPINGYRISDVIVDGKSVGTVSTYTFDSVKANHTIQVKFVKYNSIVADPEVTGVAGWLQTKEHNGYMSGYGNGLFGPNNNMTRAQAAQMFYNLLLNKKVDITVDFTDVPADAWYGNAVRTLASLGVIKGIGDGQFAPNRTITRAEFTVIAMRFANVSADVTNLFTDIASNDWYYTAVTSAVSYGWINGYSDGSFRPQATITRAEVVTIVNRMLNRAADRNFVESNVTAQFDDVPNTYWAYYNIMEATIAHDHSIDNDGVESWGKQK